MVRLMLTLTPIVCMLSAIAISETFNAYLPDEEEDEKDETPAIQPAGRAVLRRGQAEEAKEKPVGNQIRSIILVVLVEGRK